jgi:hypothetical protein
MGFDRSKWRIQGQRRLCMREPHPVAKRHADALRIGERLQRVVEIDARVGADAGRRARLVRPLGKQRASRFAPPAAGVEPRRDAADPGAERALAAELGDLLEAGQEGVLRAIVGGRRVRPHAAQQRAHRRAVPAHQLAEGAPVAGAAERHEL